MPEWLKDFAQWLSKLLHDLFSPIGELLGLSWPVMRTIGIALGVLIVFAILWFWVIRPLLDARRPGGAEPRRVRPNLRAGGR